VIAWDLHLFSILRINSKIGGEKLVIGGIFSKERWITNQINDMGDKTKRIQAVRNLKQIGKPTIPYLIEVLGDPDREAFAALLLSEIGEPAIPALLDVLSDDSRSTYASVALNEMSKDKPKTQTIIIPGLIDALVDERKQVIAILTLQNFGISALEPFIPILINYLGNKSAGASAAKSLIDIGKPAVGLLMNITSDNSKQGLPTYILQEIAKKENTVQIPITTKKASPVQNIDFGQPSKPNFCKYCGASLTQINTYCSQCGRIVE
jgi:hypothetical protein